MKINLKTIPTHCRKVRSARDGIYTNVFHDRIYFYVLWREIIQLNLRNQIGNIQRKR